MISELVATAKTRLTVSEPAELAAIKKTVKEPSVAYEWLGFLDVLVPPSPKSHCQDVGVPVEVSVKATAWPGAGEAGLKVKDASRDIAGTIVKVRLAELLPDPPVTARLTVNDPAVV